MILSQSISLLYPALSKSVSERFMKILCAVSARAYLHTKPALLRKKYPFKSECILVIIDPYLKPVVSRLSAFMPQSAAMFSHHHHQNHKQTLSNLTFVNKGLFH